MKSLNGSVPRRSNLSTQARALARRPEEEGRAQGLPLVSEASELDDPGEGGQNSFCVEAAATTCAEGH